METGLLSLGNFLFALLGRSVIDIAPPPTDVAPPPSILAGVGAVVLVGLCGFVIVIGLVAFFVIRAVRKNHAAKAAAAPQEPKPNP